MAEYRQEGKVLDYTATADVKLGDIVVFGARVGVAEDNIAKGDVGALAVEGVYRMPKKASLAISAGEEVYYSATDKTVSKTNTDVDAGYAVEDAAADATTVCVKLRG